MIRTLLAAVLCLLPLASPAMLAAAEPGPPKAYLIAEIAVHDAATYEGYRAAIAPLIARFGGRYLARGGAAEVVEGEAVEGRIIILEFPSATAARSYLQSDAHRSVAAIRHKSAVSRVVMVEGVTP